MESKSDRTRQITFAIREKMLRAKAQSLLPRGLLFMFSLALLALSADPATVAFEAPKFGVKAQVPKDWEIAVRERNEYVFVAKVLTADPDRPGAVACELGLAPESLDEYRARIDGN